MGVTSLIRECSQLGVPVDIAKLTAEIDGLTADQVLELRLEQLLLNRKLEMSGQRRTSEALDFQKQLEEVSKQKEEEVAIRIFDIQCLNSKLERKENEIASQKEEIKKLKAEIQKIRRKESGDPGFQKEITTEENDGALDTLSWAKGEIDNPRNEAGRREEEPAPDDELQAGDDAVTVNVTTSSSVCTEPDMQSHLSHSMISSDGDQDDDDDCSLVVNLPTTTSCSRRKTNIGNVTNIRDHHEDMESSKIQSDEEGSAVGKNDSSSNSDADTPISAGHGSPTTKGESKEATILQSQASAPAPFVHPEDMESSKIHGEEIISQKEEIKMKEAIQKTTVDSGDPGVQMESNPETDFEDFDVFDWAGGEMESVPGNEDGGPKVVSAPDNESQVNDDGAMIDESTATSGYAEHNLQSLQSHSIVRSVARNRDDSEEPEINANVTQSTRIHSSSKPDDDVVVSKSPDNLWNASGSREVVILQSEASAPTYHLRRKRQPVLPIRDLDSSCPKAKSITSGKPFRCLRCFKMFKSKRGFHYHLFHFHSKDPQLFRCEPCGLAYFSEDEFKRHKKNIRCRRKNLKRSRLYCTYCSKVFKSKVACTQHLKIHPRRQADGGGARAKVDESTLTSGYAEHDLQSFQSHSRGGSVSCNRNDNYEAPENSSPREQEIGNEEDEGRNQGEPKVGKIPVLTEASAPTCHLRRKRRTAIPKRYLDSSLDISFPPEFQRPKVKRNPPHKLFRCHLCSKLLNTKGRLQSHLFSIHSKDPAVFTCGTCELGYISEGELKRHVNYSRCRRNTESSRLKCIYCSKVFISRKACCRHERMHLGRNGEMARAQCEYCPNSYSSLDNLGRHKRRHHPQQI